MDSVTKKTFITKYLKEDALKSRGAWPREMKLFNGLAAAYPVDSFWHWYNPGFKLNSLAFFLGDGKAELAAAHQAYLFEQQRVLDKVSKECKVDVKQEPIIPPRPLSTPSKTLSSWLRAAKQ